MMAVTACPSPVVSVVLPTYNRAHLLPLVLESILNQDFRDLELVIVDDGSTDSTAVLVREIQKRDTRVQYVPLCQNHGVGFAREAGRQYTLGKYIALADSDDIWLSGKLREQVAALDRYPDIDILFGDFWDVDRISGTRHLVLERSPGLQEVMVRQVEEGLFVVEKGIEIGILRSNFVATPTIILRREVFDRVGGFITSLKTSEDLEFWWRAAVLGTRFAFINKPLIERHVHGDSLTAQGDQPWLERLKAVEVMYQTCRRLERQDLLKHVRATELRTYYNLLRIYGERNHRKRIFWAYIGSLKHGISVRTLGWLLVALTGPRTLSWMLRLRGSLMKAGTR